MLCSPHQGVGSHFFTVSNDLVRTIPLYVCVYVCTFFYIHIQFILWMKLCIDCMTVIIIFAITLPVVFVGMCVCVCVGGSPLDGNAVKCVSPYCWWVITSNGWYCCSGYELYMRSDCMQHGALFSYNN